MNISGRSFLLSFSVAILALILSMGLLLSAFILSENRASGSVEASDAVIAIPAASLSQLVGSAVARDGRLAITGYQPQGGQHHAIAVWRGRFDAQTYSTLRFHLDSESPHPTVNLTWRSEEDPQAVHSTPLDASMDPSTALVDLGDHPQWKGAIVELGVYVIAQRANQKMTIGDLQVGKGSWRTALEGRWKDWTHFRGWSQRSINYLYGTQVDRDTSPAVVFALWCGLAAVIAYLLTRLFRSLAQRTFAGVTFLCIVFIVWVALDLLWQSQLDAQVASSRITFGGKSVIQKHEADFDAPYFRYAAHLKQTFLPQNPARMFIVHEAITHDFERLKMQYYLLPHNSYNFRKGPSSTLFRKGDYVLVLGEQDYPRYDQSSQKLRWEHGKKLRVRVVDEHAMGTLYQVKRSAWRAKSKKVKPEQSKETPS